MKLLESGVGPFKHNMPSMVRVGRKSSTHSNVHPILANTLANELETVGDGILSENATPSSEALRKVVSSARIVGVTALSAPRSPLLHNENFDVVIVDEAGQITQPAIIGALLAADSFVLVGDHMQLTPLVVSELAIEGSKSHASAELFPYHSQQLMLRPH
jgi:DNA replication ATP-dependent helicase Dna2